MVTESEESGGGAQWHDEKDAPTPDRGVSLGTRSQVFSTEAPPTSSPDDPWVER